MNVFILSLLSDEEALRTTQRSDSGTLFFMPPWICPIYQTEIGASRKTLTNLLLTTDLENGNSRHRPLKRRATIDMRVRIIGCRMISGAYGDEKGNLAMTEGLCMVAGRDRLGGECETISKFR